MGSSGLYFPELQSYSNAQPSLVCGLSFIIASVLGDNLNADVNPAMGEAEFKLSGQNPSSYLSGPFSLVVTHPTQICQGLAEGKIPWLPQRIRESTLKSWNQQAFES